MEGNTIDIPLTHIDTIVTFERCLNTKPQIVEVFYIEKMQPLANSA